MDDLISRQAAVELIKNYCENGCDLAEDNWCPSCQREQFVKLLKELPSAEPEIVMCKDCKHAIKDGLFGGYWCKGKAVTSDHCCGYAERRTDEGDT